MPFGRFRNRHFWATQFEFTGQHAIRDQFPLNSNAPMCVHCTNRMLTYLVTIRSDDWQWFPGEYWLRVPWKPLLWKKNLRGSPQSFLSSTSTTWCTHDRWDFNALKNVKKMHPINGGKKWSYKNVRRKQFSTDTAFSIGLPNFSNLKCRAARTDR